MKPFFSPPGVAIDSGSAHEASPFTQSMGDGAAGEFSARLAVYDAPAAAPRVFDVVATSPGDLIERLSATTYSLASDAGSQIPYTVMREIVENLIHADFREIVVSVLPGGNELRFADQGPGIPDKNTALLPGYTTATGDMKRFIRGVGSGFPLVREFLEHQGGELEITDNLRSGTVVTLRAISAVDATQAQIELPPTTIEESPRGVASSAAPRLTDRQKKVLSLVLEYDEVGPTLVSRELGVGLSTAHRDLAFLEDGGLITSNDGGKRVLTETGSEVISRLFL